MDSNISDSKWDGLAMPRRLGAIIAICTGVSIAILDGSITNVALPTIAQELSISEANSVWVVNAYQLVIMLTLLTGSALGEIIGYKKIYLGGIFIFLLGSISCTFSQTFEQLILSRAIQGFGASGTMSVNTSLIKLTYPQKKLGQGVGINATMVAISAVAGPSLAAAILSLGDWHMLFAINIPICILALCLGFYFLPKNPTKAVGRKINWADSILNALTFGLLIFCIEGASHGLNIYEISWMLVGLVVIGGYFIHTQLHREYPILPFDLLRKPIFSLSVLTSIASFTAQMLGMVGLPFFIQSQLGYDDVTSGLIMTSWPVVIIFIAPLAGYLVGKVHAGILGGVGLSIMTVGFITLIFAPNDVSIPNLVWRMMLCGGGFALFQSPNNSILLASAPPDRNGSASGMLATARLIGQTSGAAIVALLFNLYGKDGPHRAFIIAACFTLFASIISISRIGLPLPPSLIPKNKQQK